MRPREAEWEARVGAGVRAALEFAAATSGGGPGPDDRGRGADAAGDRQDDLIAYFTQLLNDAAPAEKLFPIAADRAMVASIAMIVRSHLVIRLRQAASGPRSGPEPYLDPAAVYRTLGRGSYGFSTHDLANFQICP